MRRRRWAPSTARCTLCSRRARPPTSRCARSASPRERIGRWDRGVDVARFDPALRDPELHPGELTVLYAGRLSKEKGATCSPTPSSPRARATRGCTSCSPAAAPRRTRCASGSASTPASSAGSRARRSRAPTPSADVFLFASRPTPSARSCSRRRPAGCRWSPWTAGGPSTLIEDGRTGLLRDARAEDLADAVCELAASPVLRRRVARAALADVRARTGRALEQLSQGYRRALGGGATAGKRMAA